MGTITLVESQDPIAALAKLHSLADVREFLNLSLRQLALHVTDPTSHAEHTISKSRIWDLEQGRGELHVEQIRQIEDVLEAALHAEFAYDRMLDESPRKFVVRITVKKRWYVRAYTACAKCRRMYHITRISSRRCQRCINRSKRK
jgi:hypothetical protein